MKPRVTPGKMCMDDRIFKNLPPSKFFFESFEKPLKVGLFLLYNVHKENLFQFQIRFFSHNEILFQELLVLYISEFKP